MVSYEPSSHENSIPNSENTCNPVSNPPSPTYIPLIALNITAQINEKLTPSTFPQWYAQFEALLIGYNLFDYVIGDNPCPPTTDPSIPNLQKTHWVRQDKLIFSAILASTTTAITPFISAAKTSKDAWTTLYTLYVSKSRTRAMQLKEELTIIKKVNQSFQEYLHTVKALVDEISLIDHPISKDDLTLYILNGLGSNFREIEAPIHAREKPLMFEELHDLLVGHDAYLRRLDATTQQLVASANYSNRGSGTSSCSHSSKGFSKNGSGRGNSSSKPDSNSGTYRQSGGSKDNKKNHKSNSQRKYTPKCQICDALGHTTKYCPCLHCVEHIANYVSTSPAKDTTWLIDSGASHNITGDLANLSVHLNTMAPMKLLLATVQVCKSHILVHWFSTHPHAPSI
ncbi:hypothetical protein F2P56_002724 [Juglans regia]|uniref:Retrovirus-related Pol polyprotein from transposon RE1 n=1 Tax=Juglans regia TaxID=51240 RepID=A0A834D9S1_JUGRE|nr:hypothetical protein F2P56_002724 [Juglans regia]